MCRYKGHVPGRQFQARLLHLTVHFLLFLTIVAAPCAVGATAVIERDFYYTVEPGDNSWILSAKLGMSWSSVAAANALAPERPLRAGRQIRVPFRRILPEGLDNGVIVNIPDRTLYLFEGGRLINLYFVAVGRAAWQTPVGAFKVVGKTKDPTWHVPPSIQKEMGADGKEVLIEMPPGDDNPLGKHWISLSLPGIGIHGTNSPWSVYRFSTHGCLRLRPEDAQALFNFLGVGTKGMIVYQPVKIAQTPDGRVLIEVYRDFYRKGISYEDEVRRRLSTLGAMQRVDWVKIEQALSARDGTVVDVTK